MVTWSRIVRLAAAATASLLPSAPAQAGTGLTLTGPATAVGDGETTVVLTASGDADPSGELEVEVDAGSVVAVMQAGNGEYQINLAPPRVALARPVNVVARLKSAARTRDAKLTYKAEPSSATLGVSRSGGSLDIRGPQTLVLARTPAIQMSVGRPPDGLPAIHASTGTVTIPERRADDGRLYFKYVPPAQRFPQFAILAGMTPEGWTFDWLILELQGMAQVNTRTKPGSIVVNRVAGVEYGPVRAGADGRVEMAVLTPPGVPRGVTVATDPGGKVTEKQLDFAAPSWNRILALCPPQSDSIVVLAVDADGRPKADESFAAQASVGSVGEFHPLADGVYEASFQSPGGGTADAKITVKIPGEPASVSSCTMVRRPASGEAGPSSSRLDVAVRSGD